MYMHVDEDKDVENSLVVFCSAAPYMYVDEGQEKSMLMAG